MVNKNSNEFKSRFLEVTVYKNYTFFSWNYTRNNNFPRTPCQSLTDPQGSADHSLGNAALFCDTSCTADPQPTIHFRALDGKCHRKFQIFWILSPTAQRHL